jgi:hypothetical protein
MPLPDREEMAFSDDSVPHDDSESPYRREFTRYKLDTSTVVERSLENEFLHVLSIIHRYARTHARDQSRSQNRVATNYTSMIDCRQEELDKHQSDYITWEVVEYWKENVNPGYVFE